MTIFQSLVSPFWSHAAEIWLLTELPEWAVEMVTLSLHMGIRAAGEIYSVCVCVCVVFNYTLFCCFT